MWLITVPWLVLLAYMPRSRDDVSALNEACCRDNVPALNRALKSDRYPTRHGMNAAFGAGAVGVLDWGARLHGKHRQLLPTAEGVVQIIRHMPVYVPPDKDMLDPAVTPYEEFAAWDADENDRVKVLRSFRWLYASTGRHPGVGDLLQQVTESMELQKRGSDAWQNYEWLWSGVTDLS